MAQSHHLRAIRQQASTYMAVLKKIFNVLYGVIRPQWVKALDIFLTRENFLSYWYVCHITTWNKPVSNTLPIFFP